MRTKTKWLSGCTAALLAQAAPALAVDGVREINHTCATTGGCFSGDTAGYPVTITQSGSYRLTGSLQRPDAATHGILISQISVTLDLNGFRIIGGTSCGGVPVTCTATGSGRGITVDNDFTSEVVVRNGVVHGSGDAGVYVGRGSRVEDVMVVSSGGDGIRAGDFSQVLRCHANENGGRGIRQTTHGVVEGSVVYTTGAGMHGIESVLGSTIRNNQVLTAGGDGIRVDSASLVAGNNVGGSQDDGIEVLDSSRVMDNVLYDNGGFGIRFSAGDSSYSGNLLSINGGTVTGAPTNINLGGNVCNGVLCP